MPSILGAVGPVDAGDPLATMRKAAVDDRGSER